MTQDSRPLSHAYVLSLVEAVHFVARLAIIGAPLGSVSRSLVVFMLKISPTLARFKIKPRKLLVYSGRYRALLIPFGKSKVHNAVATLKKKLGDIRKPEWLEPLNVVLQN